MTSVQTTTFDTESKPDQAKPVDFEGAMEATGFGIFNIIVLIMSLPTSMAIVLAAGNISYVLPMAECDLNLSLIDKGVLNASPFAGMLITTVFWGYISDRVGRKKVALLGFVMEFLFAIGASLSNTFACLTIFKFLGGCAISGPGTILVPYSAESQGKKHRNWILLAAAMIGSIPILLLAVMAMEMLPICKDTQIFGFTLHSWQIFLLVSSIPSFVSAILLALLPESPKFLMTQGRNDEALKVFQLIYAMNKLKSKSSYPIKHLIKELDSNVASTQKPVLTIVDTFKPLKVLLHKPLLGLSLSCYLTLFCLNMGQMTFRLWVPQMFASTTEKQNLSASEDLSLCSIIEYVVNKPLHNVNNGTLDNECQINISSKSFESNIFIASTNIINFIVVIGLVRFLGLKRVLIIGLLIGILSGASLYFSKTPLTTLILACLYLAMGGATTTLVVTIGCNLFPTNIRSLVVSIVVVCGHIGTLVGSIVFPMVMANGCISVLVFLSSVMLISFILSLYLPHADNVSMK